MRRILNRNLPFDNHSHSELRLLQRSYAKEPAVNARMFLVHDCLFILANDVASIILLCPATRPGLSGLGVVNGHHFLCCARLASRVDSCGFDRTRIRLSPYRWNLL